MYIYILTDLFNPGHLHFLFLAVDPRRGSLFPVITADFIGWNMKTDWAATYTFLRSALIGLFGFTTENIWRSEEAPVNLLPSQGFGCNKSIACCMSLVDITFSVSLCICNVYAYFIYIYVYVKGVKCGVKLVLMAHLTAFPWLYSLSPYYSLYLGPSGYGSVGNTYPSCQMPSYGLVY